MAQRGVNIRVGWDLKAFRTSSQNLSRGLDKVGKKMTSVGKSMTRNLTAPIVALGGIAVKVFADFEQSMAKVAAVSGATGVELANLTKLAMDLGISTRFTAKEIAELQLNYAKLGFSSKEIDKITESTLDLALATGSDLASSAETAGATLRGFGLEAGQMQRVVDVMAKSFSSSALNLERFSTSMASLAPVAKNAGISLEQATGFLSILVDRGVDATTAGTGLRNIFLDLAGSGKTLEAALNQIHNSTNKNKVAFDLFGKRGATVAAIMAENSEEAIELSNQYVNSAGAAKKMADIMDKTLQGSLFKLKSAAEGLAISFGKILAPTISKIAKKVSELAIKFSEMSPEAKTMVIRIASLIAISGPLILAIGGITTALAFLAANPIVLVLAGLTLLALKISGVLDVLTPVDKKVKELSKSLKVLAVASSKAKHSIELETDQVNSYFEALRKTNKGSKERQTLINNINKTYGTTLKNLEDENAFVSQLDSTYKDLIISLKKKIKLSVVESSLTELVKIESSIQSLIDTLSDKLPESASFDVWKFTNNELNKQRALLVDNQKAQEKLLSGGFFEEMASGAGKLTDGIGDVGFAIDGIGKKLKDVVIQTDKILGKGLLAKLIPKERDIKLPKVKIEFKFEKPKIPAGALDFIDEMAQVAKMKAIQIGLNISEAINEGIQSVAVETSKLMGQFLSDIITGADKDARVDFGRGILNMLGGFMQEFGAAMIAIGIAESAIANAIALGPLGAPLAIAGGIALIAAGSVLSNISKKGLDGGGGASASVGTAGGYTPNYGLSDSSNFQLTTVISGRDMILVSERERSFRR